MLDLVWKWYSSLGLNDSNLEKDIELYVTFEAIEYFLTSTDQAC